MDQNSSKIMQVIVCLIVLFSATASINAAAWLNDDMPYWLWADRWEGRIAAHFRLIDSAEPDADPYYFDGKMTWGRANVTLDLRQVENNEVTWRGSKHRANLFFLETQVRRRLQETILPIPFSIESNLKKEGEGITELCEDNTLLAVLWEEAQFHIRTEAGRDFPVGRSYWTTTGTLEFSEEKVKPYFGGALWDDLPVAGEGLEGEHDFMGGPHRGLLTGEDQRSSDDNRDVLAWSLEPTFNQGQWRRDYEQNLRAEREDWIKKWEEIQREHDGIVGRGADRVLRDYEKWIAQLLDDSDRILSLLLERQVPNFLVHMSDREPRIAQAVVAGPAETSAIIHRHLWSFVPQFPAGSIRIFRNRLPTYLRDLYPTTQELEKVLIMPR